MTASLVEQAGAYFEELLTGAHASSDWQTSFVDELRLHWVESSPMEHYAMRPFLVDRSTYEQLTSGLLPVVNGLTKAVDQLATDESLRRKLGVPKYLDDLLGIDREHGKPSCLGRLDAILTEDGRLGVIEYNAEPQSAPFQHELGCAFRKLPLTRDFAARYSFSEVDLYDRVYRVLRERGEARGVGLPTVVVLSKNIYGAEHERSSTWFRPLMFAASRGCKVMFLDPEELSYENGALTCGDVVVHMVAFPGWKLPLYEPKRMSDIFAALSDDAIDVWGGFSRGLLASNKGTLEVLSDPEYRDLFDAETARALDEHVPWTRVLRDRKTDYRGSQIDLLDHVGANKRDFIIKPSGRGGGVGVVVGELATASQWQKAIKQGIPQRSIVQERLVPARQRWPIVDSKGKVEFHDVSCEFTPYVWNARELDGVLCRVTTGPLLYDFGDALTVESGLDTVTWILDD